MKCSLHHCASDDLDCCEHTDTNFRFRCSSRCSPDDLDYCGQTDSTFCPVNDLDYNGLTDTTLLYPPELCSPNALNELKKQLQLTKSMVTSEWKEWTRDPKRKKL